MRLASVIFERLFLLNRPRNLARPLATSKKSHTIKYTIRRIKVLLVKLTMGVIVILFLEWTSNKPETSLFNRRTDLAFAEYAILIISIKRVKLF